LPVVFIAIQLIISEPMHAFFQGHNYLTYWKKSDRYTRVPGHF